MLGASGFTIGWNALAGASILATFVGAVVAVVVDKRRKDLVELYKGLYEAKHSETKDLSTKIERLSAQVELFQSDFIRQLAEGVTEAILRIVDERLAAQNDHT